MSVPDWNVPERRAERWDGLKRDLETIAAHASMAGLEYLLIENLVRCASRRRWRASRSCSVTATRSTLPWRLCLDVGHQCVPGHRGR